MGNVAAPLFLFILIFTMVTAVTRLCDCSKCGQWRHAQIHSCVIVKRQEQWEANPRFYACEYIIGDIHNEESYTRTNNNNMYPGVGYAAVSSPLSLLSPTLFSSTPLSKVASLLRKSRAKQRSERTQRPTQSGGKSLLRPVFYYTFHD
jgi:hypothetical protein